MAGRILGLLSLLLLLQPAALPAQEAPARGTAAHGTAEGERLPGFDQSAQELQRELERRLMDAVSPDSVARWARSLAARPHVAGTEAQAATRDSVTRWLAERGLAASYDTFVVYLPWPLAVSVERTRPDPLALRLAEEPLPEDPYTGGPAVPVFNAYSAPGQVEAELVYVHYGLPEDYRVLDSLGVRVEGKVAVARYGMAYRGIKAREAERRGAAALLLYSDPAGDGYRLGEVYPAGPMRPPSGVERGSVLNVTGDPSTPGWPSLPGAERLPEDAMPGMPGIPVVPMGYGPAAELLRGLEGRGAPPAWQGALPFFYRLGPGPVRARVTVRRETSRDAYHPIHNTVAVLEGTDWPDEWVVVGAHRDAWGPGALDNVSGTAAVVEAARVFAALAAEGRRPRRTVLFATWDAEEWGLIGSTEWVERHEDELATGGVAYLNLDGIASGPDFGAAAAPPLKGLVRAAAAAVRHPDEEGSVLDRWRAGHAEAAREGAETGPPPVALPEPEVPVGELGGGSDHKPFYQWAGVPSAFYGFRGPGGVYHSAYDTPAWMERFGDPGYLRHAAVARITAVLAARLANADLLPYDFVSAGRQLERMLAELAAERPEVEAALPPALEAAGSFRVAAEELAAAADRFLAADPFPGDGAPAPERLRRANAELREANRSFLSEETIPGDALARHLLFVSDPADGYATLGLPTLRLALREGEMETFRSRLEELTARTESAAARLRAAREFLTGR